MNYRIITRERKQIRDDSGIRQAYQEWLTHPMTQRVIGILTVQGQPSLASPIDGSVAAQALGHAAGWADCLNVMQFLDEQARPEVEATYEEEKPE